jgi:predicted DNA-binding transcriptional regulator AlpA
MTDFRFVNYNSLKLLGWPYSRAWTMKLVKLGRFPKPLQISARATLWLWSDIEEAFTALPRGIGEQRGRPRGGPKPNGLKTNGHPPEDLKPNCHPPTQATKRKH